jgi:hypothetical protein
VHLLVCHITTKHYVAYYFGQLIWKSHRTNEMMVLLILPPPPQLLHSLTTLMGISPLIFKVFRSHSDTPYLVGHLWKRGRPLAASDLYLRTQHSQQTHLYLPIHNTHNRHTTTCQHTTLTTDIPLPAKTQHSQQTHLYLPTHNTHNRHT